MILPGNMSLSLLTKLVTDWIGGNDARMVRLGTTYRVPVQPDHTSRCRVHHQQLSRDASVRDDIWIENEKLRRLVTVPPPSNFQSKNMPTDWSCVDSTTGRALTGCHLMLRKSGVATSAPVTSLASERRKKHRHSQFRCGRCAESRAGALP